MKLSQTNLLPYDGELHHYPNFFQKDLSDIEKLKKELEWRNDKIKMFGKEYSQKREVAWCGDVGVRYVYSGIELISKGWEKETGLINDKIRKDFGAILNSCLINLYKDGEDYMSYHSDSEKELGQNPEIFSVSFGVTRDFLLKHNETKEVVKLSLAHGDLVVMKGEIQHFWKHSLPKRKNVNQERMNLTFRKIYRL